MSTIVTERLDDDPLARVVISKPERRNAVSRAETQELAATIRDLDADDGIRAVVLTGEGDAFCAGLDLTTVGEEPSTGLVNRSFHAAVREIATASMPVIARVDGPAVGAGAALAIACDLVYAAEDASIGFSFAKIGLSADTGATWTLPRLVGVQTAFELLSTGRMVDATEAASLGLVTETASGDALDELVTTRAVELANGPTRAFAAIRRLLLRANANTLEEHLEREATAQIEAYHTDDSSEGIEAFVADRDPDFQGQ
ncbi:enoyl-CoA hydratase/carnithine racemase [Halovivax ruber XH-70]|uniref:Enoyl-CoA hydratase/carnithine racemase n=1 Tax=Halovivax ruber (strain DSM 18193 / JCM 13892 / XH-70) TaxID=797302 RepID=L0IAK8_HALRX|nr:enoyl-CoA hydratase-related protein [Halovivax ruber]AGB15271.1 enoyl-CoA hydratase/carnithine racemase [Halovivax ruber XH-70]